MQLAKIVGYQLGMARGAALRSRDRLLADCPFRPADTNAPIPVQKRLGCDPTMLGRAQAGNRSAGRKVAGRLEAQGLLAHSAGRDRRSCERFITSHSEPEPQDLLGRHAQAEARLTACLEPSERAVMLRPLGQMQQAVDSEEADPRRASQVFDTGGGTASRISQHADV